MGNSAKAWIVKYGGGVSLILIVVWPLATLPLGVFPKAIWNLWVAVAFMWGWAAALMIIGLPIYENRGRRRQGHHRRLSWRLPPHRKESRTAPVLDAQERAGPDRMPPLEFRSGLHAFAPQVDRVACTFCAP